MGHKRTKDTKVGWRPIGKKKGFGVGGDQGG